MHAEIALRHKCLQPIIAASGDSGATCKGHMIRWSLFQPRQQLLELMQAGKYESEVERVRSCKGKHLLREGLLGRARGEGDALLGVAVIVGRACKHTRVRVA